jgi:two-component system LytT family response regulator
MNAVIIDDIQLAIQSLTADIEDYCPELNIVGTANSVVSGAKLLKNKKPQLIFLDIEMPDGTGFDLLDLIEEHAYHVIFTTGSKEYAIKAFQYAAVDYLLKPVDSELLISAVNKVNATLPFNSKQNKIIQDQLKPAKRTHITLNTQEEIRVVKLLDIVRCESMDNYTRFILKDATKIVVSKTLKSFENELPKEEFFRSHQSHLVAINEITSYVKTEGGYLLMSNGDQIPVSVRKKPMVLDILNN